jgi:hypothetical protein
MLTVRYARTEAGPTPAQWLRENAAFLTALVVWALVMLSGAAAGGISDAELMVIAGFGF